MQIVSPANLDGNGDLQCGEVEVEMLSLPPDVKKDLCVMKYHFDVAGFSQAMSGSYDTDGVSQLQYGIPWPLGSRVCPVLVKLLDRNGEEFERDFEMRLRFDLSHEEKVARYWFDPRAPDRHSGLNRNDPQITNEFAYHDVSFAGVCEQWGYREGTQAALGSWHEARASNGSKVRDAAGNWVNEAVAGPVPDEQDMCQLMRNVPEAEPEKLASGIVECLWSATDRARTGVVMADLFAVVAERADCAGIYSRNSSLDTVFDFNIGQFEIARVEPTRTAVQDLSRRKVCDRCMKCGLYNDCSTGCDNSFPPLRQLDLCGYCGGNCFGEDQVLGEDIFGEAIMGTCTEEQCGNLYLRYLGGQGNTVKTCTDMTCRKTLSSESSSAY